MNKAIFFDRDGTLIEEKQFLHKIEDVVFKPQVFEALKVLQDRGYLFFIVTNQSGVARGYFNEEDVITVNKYIINEFTKKGITFTDVYFCPHHIEGTVKGYNIDCNCRKPNTGMIDNAVVNYDVDLSKSFMIGDKDLDIQLGNNLNMNSILFENTIYENNNSNFVLKSNKFLDIADFILKSDNYEG